MNFLSITVFFVLNFFLTSTNILFAAPPPCYKNIEATFFLPGIVEEALSLHAVSQSNWSLIHAELREKMKRVPELVRERARKLSPNPFGTPFQPQEASAILRQVLYNIFSETLADFHVTNQGKVEEMFQYIRQRQGQRLLACFGDEIETERTEAQ